MDENEEVVPTEEVPEEVAPVETAEVEEDTTDYKALAEQKDQAFQDQKRRAEKAERELKENKKQVASNSKADDDLSSKDILALSTSGISDEEDIEFLQKAAKLNGTSLSAALKDPTVSGLLKAKQEERRTATATTTSGTRRTSTERKGSDILANAKADNMPASGKDTRKMVRASLGLPD